MSIAILNCMKGFGWKPSLIHVTKIRKCRISLAQLENASKIVGG